MYDVLRKRMRLLTLKQVFRHSWRLNPSRKRSPIGKFSGVVHKHVTLMRRIHGEAL